MSHAMERPDAPRRAERAGTPFTAAAALRPLAWILAIVGVLRMQADPDLWGHARFGLDLLRERSLPERDPYSFTQDVPWVNHEWLSELAMGGAYALGGSAGLMLLKGLLVAATFAVIARATRRLPDGWRWGGLALAVWGSLPIAVTLRPHLWTLLGVAVLCRILASPDRYLRFAPVLLLVWVNLHGGWIVGLGMLGAWAAGRLIDRRPPAPRPAVVIGLVALSAAATLVNPYGWGLWGFIAQTVGMSRPDITEWQPIWRDSFVTVLQWLAAVGFVALCLRRGGRPSLGPLLVIGMLAYASLRVNRLVPLFVETAVLLAVPALPAAADLAAGVRSRARALMDAAAVAVALAFAVQANLVSRCIALDGRWLPDAAGARALRDAGARGRLVTAFDWGEYAIWHLAPGLKVSVDGRRETVYSQATLREQFAIAAGTESGLLALQRLSPEYVWLPLPRSARTREWLSANGYRIDVETERSFVAARADLPPIDARPAPAPACFPGG